MLLPLAAMLGAVATWNYVLDPFGMNGRFARGLDRDRVARILSYQLYKTIEFQRSPRPVLILGDSRCDLLRPEYFARAGRTGVYNMSFGGGTLPEAIDAFWFADAHAKLQSVVLCVPFNLYNEFAGVNRVPEALALQQQPLAYYLSPFVAKAGVHLLYERFTGRLLRDETPDVPRDEFWRRQLGSEVARSLSRWQRPERLQRRLEEVSRHCREAGIELTFLIPPNHVELQAKVDEYGLRPEYDRMKVELAELAPVVDLDLPSELTRGDSNYKDPFHLTPEAAEQVVRELVHRIGS